jgi:hypothetical protein
VFSAGQRQHGNDPRVRQSPEAHRLIDGCDEGNPCVSRRAMKSFAVNAGNAVTPPGRRSSRSLRDNTTYSDARSKVSDGGVARLDRPDVRMEI